MQYNALVKQLKFETADDGSKVVTMTTELFNHLLRGALKAKGIFDERFYILTNPDIAHAVRSKKFTSGSEHYFETGYFENRFPKRFLVDEKYYLKENPDVADGIRKRTEKSGQSHFDGIGFNEGRSPYKDFSLF
jgi:hypothetical protein